MDGPRSLSDALIRGWTEPLLRDRRIVRDLLAYGHGRWDAATLVRETEALRGFAGDVLVLWSPDNKVMPPEHGRRLAELLPAGRLVEIPGAYVLSQLDEPEAVARELGAFLREQAVSDPGSASR